MKRAYASRDGEAGYPGKLAVEVCDWWMNEDGLRIEYRASTDKPTPLNLTHHSHFNLQGEGSGNILQHALRINAERYTPVNDDTASLDMGSNLIRKELVHAGDFAAMSANVRQGLNWIAAARAK